MGCTFTALSIIYISYDNIVKLIVEIWKHADVAIAKSDGARNTGSEMIIQATSLSILFKPVYLEVKIVSRPERSMMVYKSYNK